MIPGSRRQTFAQTSPNFKDMPSPKKAGQHSCPLHSCVKTEGPASLGRSRDGSCVGQLRHTKCNVLVGHVDLGVRVEAVAVHLALDLQVSGPNQVELLPDAPGEGLCMRC